MMRIYERLLAATFNAADVPRKVARRGLEVACILRAYQRPSNAPWVPTEDAVLLRPQTADECAASALRDGLALADAIRRRR